MSYMKCLFLKANIRLSIGKEVEGVIVKSNLHFSLVGTELNHDDFGLGDDGFARLFPSGWPIRR